MNPDHRFCSTGRCGLPEWECDLLNHYRNVEAQHRPAPSLPTVTHGPIKAELMFDPSSDVVPAVAEAHMIRVETPQGFVEVTVSNGATHVMISESRMGETKGEFLIGSNGFFQKIG